MSGLIFALSVAGVGFIAMVALYAGRMSPRSESASNVGFLMMSGWSALAPNVQVYNCIINVLGLTTAFCRVSDVKVTLAETIAAILPSARPSVFLCPVISSASEQPSKNLI
jgi:hypothetical protein